MIYDAITSNKTTYTVTQGNIEILGGSMSTMIKSISILLFVFVSSFAYSETMTVRAAQKQVAEYQALRRVCTVSILDTKQGCFKELKELTHKYKSAKHYLVMNRPQKEELIVGYAQ